VHFALLWIKVAYTFQKAKSGAKERQFQWMIHVHIASWQLQERYTVVWVEIPLFFISSWNCIYTDTSHRFAQLLQCIFTLSAPASFCICSLRLKLLVLFFTIVASLFSNLRINNLVCLKVLAELIYALFLHCFLMNDQSIEAKFLGKVEASMAHPVL
jgi:hypothetical protein